MPAIRKKSGGKMTEHGIKHRTVVSGNDRADVESEAARNSLLVSDLSRQLKEREAQNEVLHTEIRTIHTFLVQSQDLLQQQIFAQTSQADYLRRELLQEREYHNKERDEWLSVNESLLGLAEQKDTQIRELMKIIEQKDIQIRELMQVIERKDNWTHDTEVQFRQLAAEKEQLAVLLGETQQWAREMEQRLTGYQRAWLHRLRLRRRS